MGSQQQSKPRVWKLWLQDYATEEDFLNAVEAESARCVWIGHRIGRGITSGPIRVEAVEGEYETIGWAFRDIFVPAARTSQPPVEPAEEFEVAGLTDDTPDPEPVEA